MEALITGANGMLGRCLKKRLKDSQVLSGRSYLDLTDLKKTKEWLGRKHFSTIIHTAAFTDLSFCEHNKEMAFCLHSSVVEILKEHCDRIIYISTVPIWNDENYKKNVYFESKRAGEHKALDNHNGVVIRTNIYGDGGLVKWAINQLSAGNKINGFSDVYFNPVHTAQLSDFIVKLMQQEAHESLYTLAGDETLSKYEFLKKVSQILNFNSSLIEPIIANKHSVVLKNVDVTFSLKQGMEILKNDY